MRIAYITETFPPEINGVALTVERTVTYLRERGHAVGLVRPRQPGEDALDSADEWRSHGLPIPMYPDLRCGLAFAATLVRRFRRTRPHLVHVATQGPLGRAALAAARRLQLAATTDFRTNFHQYSRYYRLGGLEPLVCRYLRDFHNRADASFVPTAALRNSLTAQGFERLEVLGRGVDAARFAPAQRSAALRAAWGVAETQPVLLYVGRLAVEKNVGLALQAYEAVRALRPELRMVVVGDGPLRAALQAAHPGVLFTGVQRGADLAHHYASADVFLFPSESETFGNVTLEALASGLGVIAYDSAAAHEHIRDGASGLLLAPGDAEGFRRAACRLVGEPALLAALRRGAREQALAARWDAVLRRLEARLLAHARAAQALRQRDVALA